MREESKLHFVYRRDRQVWVVNAGISQANTDLIEISVYEDFTSFCLIGECMDRFFQRALGQDKGLIGRHLKYILM